MKSQKLVGSMSEQLRNLAGRTVSEAKPDYLRRRAAEDTQAVEVLVFRHKCASVLPSHFPDDRVGGTLAAERSNVERTWEQIGQKRDQVFRELFVEKQAHGSGGWKADRPTLSFGRVREARANVVAGQLRKVAQNLILRHPRCEIPQHVAHGDARSPDARLAEPDVRVDRDAFECAHASSLRQIFEELHVLQSCIDRPNVRAEPGRAAT
jgi:hypothetical protein